MATLYPVIVENSIPAFPEETEVQIPFYLNRGNTSDEVYSCEVNICSIYGRVLKTIKANLGIPLNSNQFFADIPRMSFEFSPGTYYKFQIRILGENSKTEYSPWSTMTIGKCIKSPKILIEGYEEKDSSIIFDQINFYMGCFSYEKDIISSAIDKPSKYCFSIIDEQRNIIDTTDWKYHNFEQDNLNEFKFYDQYIPKVSMNDNKIYYLKYEVITENQYYTSTSINITSEFLYPIPEEEFGLKLSAAADNDNGCINLTITALDPNKVLNGEYIISRFNGKNEWQDFFQFKMISNINPIIKKKDWWVEQGIEYQYSLQKVNQHNIRTQRFLSEKVVCNFEDMFLSDNERVLKIQFSPEVSSFKAHIIESKVDTIGSKYPFIFRNGNVNYKEFPIGGKISYLMDKDFLFMNNKDLNLLEDDNMFDIEKIPTTNLTSENIKRERIFKLNVLDWLNNGKPKLFKSPAEGNYIVKLMNVSLSPENALGRMIHSFSSTAYEIADNSYQNLKVLSLLDSSLEKNYSVSEDFVYKNKILNSESIKEENVLDCAINYFKITDANPGTIITLTLEDENQSSFNIIIGSTGQYESSILKDYIIGMKIKSPNPSFYANLYYHGFLAVEKSEFDKIEEVSLKYLFKTLTGEESKNNTLSSLLISGKGETISILKIKFYIEDYDLVNDNNSKIIIKMSEEESVSIDIAASDLLELDVNTFGEVLDIEYPSQCVVATECYYKKMIERVTE